jgi:Fe-S-cluster-containing dehydrogenase component
MNLAEKKLLIVLDCCIGCHACEIACRQEHELTYETGSKWCQVMTIKPRRIRDELHLDYFPIMCLHCENPLCIQGCPVDAILRRKDGIVFVDREKCNGCKVCLYACPYGAMSFDEESQVAGKCNFCLERLEFGIEPSCVQHCIGGALRYVTQEDLEKTTRGKHTAFFGKVCYASSQWRLAQLRGDG